MKAVSLEEVKTYVLLCQNIAARYISTRTILELCMLTEQRQEVKVTMRWWEQV